MQVHTAVGQNTTCDPSTAVGTQQLPCTVLPALLERSGLDQAVCSVACSGCCIDAVINCSRIQTIMSCIRMASLAYCGFLVCAAHPWHATLIFCMLYGMA
jgi:hypothetical protein